jgi:oligopeptide transport system ATP-binding protein
VSELLQVSDAVVSYRRPAGKGTATVAVAGVSFTVAGGEFLGLVGESGCGKSSLGRALLGLVRVTDGEVRWQGRRIDALPRRAFRALRRELQLVFQDPQASFDPRMTIAESVAEPLRALAPALSPAARAAEVERQFAEVGLGSGLAERYPHQLSGGQLQRAGLARALIVDPRFLVCDEPVSALDVSVQGQIVNLLARIRRERGLACLFISHNLAIVGRISDRIMVMYRGRIVESAPCGALLAGPPHGSRGVRPVRRWRSRTPSPPAAHSRRAARTSRIAAARVCRRCGRSASGGRSPATEPTNGRRVSSPMPHDGWAHALSQRAR